MIKLICISSLADRCFIAGKTYQARPLGDDDSDRYLRYMIESEDYPIDDGYIIWIYKDGDIVIPGCDGVATFVIAE